MTDAEAFEWYKSQVPQHQIQKSGDLYYEYSPTETSSIGFRAFSLGFWGGTLKSRGHEATGKKAIQKYDRETGNNILSKLSEL